MKKIIQILKVIQSSELNNSELLVLCELSDSGYMRIQDMSEKFKWGKRFAEDNVKRLHQKGYLARSGQGNRYRLSKNGIHYTTEVFQMINKVGAALDVKI